jgi:WD40 repeat protein
MECGFSNNNSHFSLTKPRLVYFLAHIQSSQFSQGERGHSEDVTTEPPDVYLDNHVFDLKFSPTSNVLAASLITGEIKVFAYNEEVNDQIMAFEYHEGACRTTSFSDDGNFIYTGGSDG